MVASILVNGRRFLDLSSWQAGIDLARARREGYEGIIVKRCGGRSYKNPHFWNMIAEAQRLDMDYGAYAYLLEPTGDPGPPEEEADYLCDNLRGDWVMPIFMDCEERNPRFPDLSDYYLRFRRRVRERTGIIPVGIYTGNYWVQENGLFDPRLGESPLWLASWQATPPPVPASGPWDRYILWQYDSRTRVANMAECDVNLFDGDRAAWRALGKGGENSAWQVKPTIVPIEHRREMPTGHTIHPYFWSAWDLGKHGYPLGPGCLYDDGRIRQLFERCVLGSNGRDEPVPFEGLGQAYHWATGRTIVDWPTVHPLVAEGMR